MILCSCGIGFVIRIFNTRKNFWGWYKTLGSLHINLFQNFIFNLLWWFLNIFFDFINKTSWIFLQVFWSRPHKLGLNFKDGVIYWWLWMKNAGIHNPLLIFICHFGINRFHVRVLSAVRMLIGSLNNGFLCFLYLRV